MNGRPDDLGTQKLTFRYNDPVDAEIDNTRLLDIIPNGIFEGLVLSGIGGSNLTISIGSVNMKVEDFYSAGVYYSMRIAFTSNVILSTVGKGVGTYKVFINYKYQQDENWYADIVIDTAVSDITDIKLGEIDVDGSDVITGIRMTTRADFLLTGNPIVRDDNIELMNRKLYDRNDVGIVDDSDKVDGKDAISGQDIIDTVIDPRLDTDSDGFVDVYDNLVSLDKTGYLPTAVIPANAISGGYVPIVKFCNDNGFPSINETDNFYIDYKTSGPLPVLSPIWTIPLGVNYNIITNPFPGATNLYVWIDGNWQGVGSSSAGNYFSINFDLNGTIFENVKGFYFMCFNRGNFAANLATRTMWLFNGSHQFISGSYAGANTIENLCKQYPSTFIYNEYDSIQNNSAHNFVSIQKVPVIMGKSNIDNFLYMMSGHSQSNGASWLAFYLQGVFV